MPLAGRQTTLQTGASSDENYVVAKNGTPIWVTGEAVLIPSEEGDCIVKVIHSLHAQKQLERYMLASSDLLDSLLESVGEYGIILLDSGLRVLKSNSSFVRMFSLNTPPDKGARLGDLEHILWKDGTVRGSIKNMVIEQTLERNLLLAVRIANGK